MNKKISVYIASPYTNGDSAVNVRRQIDAVDVLLDNGFMPFAPLYSHFQHMVHPRKYDEWISYDLYWVNQCDCLLRLDGDSTGADLEVREANRLGKQVFYSFDELFQYFNLINYD